MDGSSTESTLADSNKIQPEPLDQFVSTVLRSLVDRDKSQPAVSDEVLRNAATGLVSRFQTELNAVQRNRDEFKTIAARAQADLINFRRRSEAERSEIAQRVRETCALKICGVADEFAAALEVQTVADEAWLDGFRGIYKNLTRILADEGYRRFDSLGLQADPYRHEAVAVIETTEAAEGCIVQVIREGYEHVSTGKVLRPALVAIAKAPATDEMN